MSEQKEFEPMMTEEEAVVVTHMTHADPPHSQRAQALLAVNEGKSAAEAGEAAGLRATQVTYWVSRYRKSGLAIFPEALLGEEEGVVVETAVSLEKSVLSNSKQASSKPKEAKGQKSVAAEQAPPDKKDKKKKSKDKKKSKKNKKDNKKDKKTKKEKKSNKSKTKKALTKKKKGKKKKK